MQFVLFTAPTSVKNELKLINTFLKDKSVLIHIRKPSYSKQELTYFLDQIYKEFHAQIVIHQHIDLLETFNLKGFHCTRSFIEKNKQTLKQLKINFPNFSFSKSCHSLAELESNESYDYVFLSPIFKSISKNNYPSNFSFNKASEAVKKSNQKVIALGGISNDNLALIKGSNFYGIAVLGAIWNSQNPALAFKEIKNKV